MEKSIKRVVHQRAKNTTMKWDFEMASDHFVRDRKKYLKNKENSKKKSKKIKKKRVLEMIETEST